MVLNLTDETGKRKPKWKATGLPVKGNKRKAEMMLTEERRKYSKSKVNSKANGNMQFADYMLFWLQQIKSQVELTTFAGYQDCVEKRIVPYFRENRISLIDLRANDIQEFYNYCMNELGLSNNRVIHFHANISKALNYAVANDYIYASPMRKGLRPKHTEHIGEFYSLDETMELFDVVSDDDIAFPVLMAAFYGLRRGEITGLKWSAIDLRNNTITVRHTVVQTRVDGKHVTVRKDRAKNKSSHRTLPLVPQFRELLLRMKAYQEECKSLCGNSYHKSEYVYVNDIGEPYKPDYITRRFSLILKKNGLRKITFHELRHTCASLLLRAGVSMKDIQAWLGHSSFSTTANIYAHLESSSKDRTSMAMANSINIDGALAPKQLTAGTSEYGKKKEDTHCPVL